MFKKSQASPPATLFSGISQHLSDRKLELLEKSDGWHNVFFREITSQIDEELFSVLYDNRRGRPNAPIRQLVAMLILKEGQDWTDEQLYEECHLNLRVMRALGLTDFQDEVPVASTYYDFKARLVKHKEETGEDLLEEAFRQLTKSQVRKFEVNGKEVRMDSKLINSNIAKCTRLQLIINVVSKFYKSLSNQDKTLLSTADQEFLQKLVRQTASQHTYRLTREQKATSLQEFGELLLRLKQTFSAEHSDEYALIERLLEEQYQFTSCEEDKEDQPPVKPKDKGDIGGKTLQSAHDPDATYRHKESGGKQQHIHGFSCNITETCAQDALRLITDVQTAAASTSDDKFFKPALENTRQVSGSIKANWTDGAYNSESNLAYSKDSENSFEWYISAIQGQESNYDFRWTDQGELLVTDRRNGRTQMAHRTPTGKYRIDEDFAKSRYRYLEPKTIENYFRRQQIKDLPEAIRKRRPNVEATIHQVFHTLDGSKSKYRGLARNHLFVLCRCFWANFKRIWAEIAQNLLFLAQMLMPGSMINQIRRNLIFLSTFLWRGKWGIFAPNFIPHFQRTF